MYQTYNIPSPVLLSAVVLLSALLAGCGGGSDSTSTAESADGTKQALAVSGATAVPPGWTGRASKYEVINGITVPPAPDPVTNNATLKGVDVNANGVRDDVERRIANDDAKNFTTAMSYAITPQRIIDGSNISDAEWDANFCLSIKSDINTDDIDLGVVNTKARLVAYLKNRRLKPLPECK